jgi:type I restriction enzyme M protein
MVNLWPVKVIMSAPTPKTGMNTVPKMCFLSRNRANGKFRNRTGEILFIDARNLGELINRRTKVLTDSDITQIAETYHNWRNPNGNYSDIPGFCVSAPIEKVKELDYVLTPGRYVGLADDEDDFDFNERFVKLKAEFEEQLKEETELNQKIVENLKKITLKNI